MTKPFSVMITCEHCGRQTSAETAFGRWMRGQPHLASNKGIVRTDTDHTILRYKTHKQGRSYQLLYDLEVKEFNSEPSACQADILYFKHQMVRITGKNVNGSRTTLTKKLKSRVTGQIVNVRYLGIHLLQFSATSPLDSEEIKWDGKVITTGRLLGLLALELDPYDPDRPMEELLRDRHYKQTFMELAL